MEEIQKRKRKSKSLIYLYFPVFKSITWGYFPFPISSRSWKCIPPTPKFYLMYLKLLLLGSFGIVAYNIPKTESNIYFQSQF